MSYLVDTNILLRSADTTHLMYPLAVNAVDTLLNQNEQLYVIAQNLIEFWNVYTRPKEKNGLGGSVKEAQTELNRIKTLLALLPDTSEIYQHWEQLVTTYQVKGVNVHDARLVAVMLVYNIPHILTFNTDDFKRYTEIIAVHPSEII